MRAAAAIYLVGVLGMLLGTQHRAGVSIAAGKLTLGICTAIALIWFLASDQTPRLLRQEGETSGQRPS